jgi:glycosyltransferase involved in cell wall biosynthesis
VVATSVGGVPQVINNDVNGLLVSPGRPDCLARALMRISADPELRRRLGRKAGEDSAAFDIARASAEIEDIYRGLLADP